MKRSEIIQILSTRGWEWLLNPPQDVIEEACSQNPWFTHKDVRFALSALSEWLENENLKLFLSDYSLTDEAPPVSTQVGIILAGNIPAAGFHDVLIAVCLQINARIRLSHQDHVLIPAFIEAVLPQVQNITFTSDFTGIDCLIASGSSLTALYLKQDYAGIPILMRSNRFSVAVIDGKESREELTLLTQDILLYNGLGCRNVSQILVPAGYKAEELIQALRETGYTHMSLPFQRKRLWEQGKEIIRGKEIDTLLPIVICRETELKPAEAGVLHWIEYENPEALQVLLQGAEEKIQCICGNHFPYSWGELQKPSLKDFADGIDTVLWLLDAKKQNINIS